MQFLEPMSVYLNNLSKIAFQMEYGLWGLPGGFWTGGTQEALTRSLFNAGHGRGPKAFSGNIGE